MIQLDLYSCFIQYRRQLSLSGGLIALKGSNSGGFPAILAAKVCIISVGWSIPACQVAI
jgi:hypothetical protein